MKIIDSFEISGIELREDTFSEHPMPEIVQNVYLHALKNEVISLESLERLTELRQLTITNSKAQEVDLSALEHLPELRKIEVSLMPKMERIDLRPLVRMSNLQFLSLAKVRMDTEQLRTLSTHPTLEALVIDIVRTQVFDLSPLSGSPELERLSIYGDNVFPTKVILPDRCPSLGRISVKHTSTSLLELHNWKSLKRFDISVNKIRSIDFEPFRDCAELESILLHYNWLERVDVTPLFECKKLLSFTCHDNVKLEGDFSSIENLPAGLLTPTYVKERNMSLYDHR